MCLPFRGGGHEIPSQRKRLTSRPSSSRLSVPARSPVLFLERNRGLALTLPPEFPSIGLPLLSWIPPQALPGLGHFHLAFRDDRFGGL